MAIDAGQAQRELAILKAIESVERQAIGLEKIFSELEGRLAKASRPMHPKNRDQASPQVYPSSGVELADTLENIMRRLQAINEDAANQMERLEL